MAAEAYAQTALKSSRECTCAENKIFLSILVTGRFWLHLLYVFVCVRERFVLPSTVWVELLKINQLIK